MNFSTEVFKKLLDILIAIFKIQKETPYKNK